MFHLLQKINQRPTPYQFYTADELWTDEYTSKQMLQYHLNDEIDLSSRNGNFVDTSVDWIASYFHIGNTKSIADFGCGPGLYTSRLARKDARVTGIDFSGNSIAYAIKQAQMEDLEVTYVQSNYLEFDTEQRFHLITMIMCDFCALSPNQRKQMLQKFFRLLEPGGSVLLDVCSIHGFNAREESATYELNMLHQFWSGEKYYGFLNTFKYPAEHVILDKYTIVEESRMRTVYNWLQYFSPDSLQKEFTDCGFEIDLVLGDVAGAKYDKDAPEFAIVAKKP